MLKTLLKHEILNLLKSKRVYYTVSMFLLLFATIFIVRVIDYQKQLNQYIADVRINEEALQEASNYSQIKPRAIQQPIIFSIFNEGFKIQRVATIQFYEPITNTTSLNEENNLVYNESTQLDITFLITFFLSLFILLISYDSVNGEKQIGTLRILMTYPLKRQSFILKKMLGIFIFVAFTFTLPYILSLISLIIIYANLLTINFFLSAFFYWFLVLLFILFFSLLGIFISCCTTNPNRSLVYSLLIWIMFSIVMPISWDYIISPKLYNDHINQLNIAARAKITQASRIMYNDIPDDANPNYVGHMNWRGNNHFFYETNVSGFKHTHEQHHRYQKYIYENYFPVSREIEQANDEVLRKRINIENVRSLVFFYNPIVLFSNISMQITGNSMEDLLRLFQDSREIRDDLVNLGIAEEWLLDSRFFAIYEPETDVFANMDQEDLSMYIYTLEGGRGSIEEFFEDYDEDRVWSIIVDIMSQTEAYNMALPSIRRYEQPVYSFGEIFGRIFRYLVMFVVSILILWILTWQRFMGYDVR